MQRAFACDNALASTSSRLSSKHAIHAVIDKALEQPDHLSAAVRSVITPELQAFQADQIRDRADLLEIIATCSDPDEKPVELLDRYLNGTNFEKSIIKQSPTAESAEAILANVAAFRSLAAKHEGTIAGFLDDIDPLIDSTNLAPPTEPHVWIGSIHRAKGAQWPVVLLPGLAARAFPRDNIEAEELEGERRLFYVAMTRAIDDLHLVHPVDPDFDESINDIKSDAKRGLECPTSPFLWEMDLAVARYAGEAIENGGPFESIPVESPAVANEYFARFPFARDWSFTRRPRTIVRRPIQTPVGSVAGLSEGVRVHHDTFGPGTFERWVDKRVYRVRFDSGETKMLVARCMRVVPIAQPLLDAGFLDFIEDMKATGHPRLFPHLSAGVNRKTGETNARYSQQLGVDFGRYLKTLGFRKGVGFHAFRHTLATELDVQDVPEREIALVTGHTSDQRDRVEVLRRHYLHKRPSVTRAKQLKALELYQPKVDLPVYQRGQFAAMLNEAKKFHP